MIICKNCGGEYDEKLLVCPFCDTENESVAYLQQNAILDDYHDKAIDVATLPDKVVKKSTKLFVKLGALFIVICLVIFVVIYFVTRNGRKDNSMDSINSTKNELEQLYLNEDYQGIYDYFQSHHNISDSYYEKYKRVSDLYEASLSIERKKEKYKADLIKYLDADDVSYDIEYILEVLNQISEYENNGYLFGEEKLCEKLKQICDDFFKNELLLSDTEIDDISSLFEKYPEKGYRELYKDSSNMIIERLNAR